MGLFDFITGNKPAPVGVPHQPVAVLRAALLAVGGDDASFSVRDGAPEKVDLVAEWKILDAKWYEYFAKAGLQRTFKVLMKFDADHTVVRSVDQQWSVDWRAGIPSLSLAVSGFRGQDKEVSYDVSFGFREDGSFGKIYESSFSTSAIKSPLKAASLASGWGWKGVAFTRL